MSDQAPRCQREGCSALAAGEIAILIPAIGGSTAPGQCCKAVLGLHVCPAHFVEEARQVDHWLTDQVRAIVVASSTGRAPLDFARAYLALERAP